MFDYCNVVWDNLLVTQSGRNSIEIRSYVRDELGWVTEWVALSLSFFLFSFTLSLQGRAFGWERVNCTFLFTILLQSAHHTLSIIDLFLILFV